MKKSDLVLASLLPLQPPTSKCTFTQGRNLTLGTEKCVESFCSAKRCEFWGFTEELNSENERDMNLIPCTKRICY